MTRITDDGWIFLQKNPLKKVSEGARVPYATCASPFCPAFNRLFQPGEHRISIEPFSNMLMKYVPSHPLADLATTCASPISGEGNVRGKGEYNCLWMHVNCAEYLGIGLLAHTDRIRIERRLSTFPGVEYKLDSPETYSVLKWIAVHTGDKSQAGLEGRDFWRKDDGLAVYLSRRQFDYVGRWKRGRIEIAAKEARDMLLSSVLAYTAVLKERAPKLKDKPDKPDRMASLPQAAKAFEQRTASRLEEVEELEAEKGMIEDEQEVNNTLSCAAPY